MCSCKQPALTALLDLAWPWRLVLRQRRQRQVAATLAFRAGTSLCLPPIPPILLLLKNWKLHHAHSFPHQHFALSRPGPHSSATCQRATARKFVAKRAAQYGKDSRFEAFQIIVGPLTSSPALLHNGVESGANIWPRHFRGPALPLRRKQDTIVYSSYLITGTIMNGRL